MRKLLVASQKGGVGKTAVSLNLAATSARMGTRVLLVDGDPLGGISEALALVSLPSGHEIKGREILRQMKVDLPGSVVTVFPGLDILCPYDGTGCTDDEFARVLGLFRTSSLQETYGCVILDTPPFLGANPGQLLNSCEEFLLVMQAEPLAYRTYPAFSALIQRSCNSSEMKKGGILLTLAEGDEPGGRWERELRGRLGNQIFPQVIPYEEEIPQAHLEQILTPTGNPALVAIYKQLVQILKLTQESSRSSRESNRGTLKTLLLASTMIKEVRTERTERTERTGRSDLIETFAEFPQKAVPETVPPDGDTPFPRRRTPTTSFPAPQESAWKPADNEAQDTFEAPEPFDSPPREPKSKPASRGALRIPSQLLPEDSAQAGSPAKTNGSQTKEPRETTSSSRTKKANSNEQIRPTWGLVWVGLAILFGVSLRFIPVPNWVLPLLVGVGVAAVVVVVMLFLYSSPAVSQPSSDPKKGRKSASAVRRRLKLPEKK